VWLKSCCHSRGLQFGFTVDQGFGFTEQDLGDQQVVVAIVLVVCLQAADDLRRLGESTADLALSSSLRRRARSARSQSRACFRRRVRSLSSSLAASSPCPASASDARTLLSWHADPQYTNLMSETATFDTESEILEQVIEPGSAGRSPETAQALLRFRFNTAAAARMNELAEKNRQGTIAPSERALFERYLRVGNFLNLIHAKARCALAEPASPAS
jgi:hypothetical protein